MKFWMTYIIFLLITYQNIQSAYDLHIAQTYGDEFYKFWKKATRHLSEKQIQQECEGLKLMGAIFYQNCHEWLSKVQEPHSVEDVLDTLSILSALTERIEQRKKACRFMRFKKPSSKKRQAFKKLIGARRNRNFWQAREDLEALELQKRFKVEDIMVDTLEKIKFKKQNDILEIVAQSRRHKRPATPMPQPVSQTDLVTMAEAWN